jgi:hypothetical protein
MALASLRSLKQAERVDESTIDYANSCPGAILDALDSSTYKGMRVTILSVVSIVLLDYNHCLSSNPEIDVEVAHPASTNPRALGCANQCGFAFHQMPSTVLIRPTTPVLGVVMAESRHLTAMAPGTLAQPPAAVPTAATDAVVVLSDFVSVSAAHVASS